MNLIQRFKNLWKLSEYTPLIEGDKDTQRHPLGSIVTPITKPLPHKQAEIIKKKTTMEDIIHTLQ